MGPNGTSSEHFPRSFVLVLFYCFESTLTKSTLERKGSVSAYKSQVKTHHWAKPEQELPHGPWRNDPPWLNRRLMLSKFSDTAQTKLPRNGVAHSGMGRFQSLFSGSLLFSCTKTQVPGITVSESFSTPHRLAEPHNISLVEPLSRESSILLCSRGISFFGFSNLLSLRAIHVGITHHLS